MALQTLDEAVCVRVVVNGGLVARGPAQEHQVELPVALVNQVTGVLVFVELGVFVPVGFLGVVGASRVQVWPITQLHSVDLLLSSGG